MDFPIPSCSSFLKWDTASTESFLGIDGARGGWVVAAWSNGTLTLNLYSTISEVPLTPLCRALIDMPIGLPSQNRRRCDAEARALLGARRSTIFPVPARAAIYANSYPECCDINQSLQGCKVSKQAWNIFPKIQELDTFLRADPSRHGFIAEAHPELAFLALHPSSTPLPSKRTPHGVALRKEILSALLPTIDEIAKGFVSSHHRALDITDTLDAISLCALLVKSRGRVSFLGDGVMDLYGAPQRICGG